MKISDSPDGHRNLTLSLNFIYIKEIHFLMMTSRSIHFGMAGLKKYKALPT